MPTLGSLTEGYILLISKRHINSMSELTDEEMKEYENLITKYRKILKNIYDKYPIVFEHGTPNTREKMKANSMTHAHTHIVNHNYKNEQLLIKKLNFKRMKKMSNLSKDKNYIFYINPQNDKYITDQFEAISQLMRIEIAKDLNITEAYDWRKNKFENNVILTINNINKYRNKEKKKENNESNNHKTTMGDINCRRL